MTAHTEPPPELVASLRASRTANIDAKCSLNTTADALTPGTVTEDKRAIWEMKEVTVLDGGADGDAETAGNTTFLQQGIFVP